MNCVHLAAAMLALASPGEAVLLDFRADWCGPCRQMDPIVAQLQAEGYTVRQVNIDNDRALAKKHNVEGIPCFVMLVDGREVDRVVGVTDRGRLQAMFSRNNAGPMVNAARGQSPELGSRNRSVPFPPSNRGNAAPALDRDLRLASHDASQRPLRASGQADSRLTPQDRMIRASVRLKIEDDVGNSCGSGTIIDARQGEALILTCGHVFRDAAKNGRIWVDFFGPGAPKGLPGRLIDYDLKADLGLLSVQTNYPVVAAPLAPANQTLQKGDRVVSVGCDGGADATIRETQVTSINRYVGPANVQVGFQPVQGRSGGGLFTPDGMVVGVCYAADPEADEGLFAALPAICQRLDENGLAFVYKAEGRMQKAEETEAMPRREVLASRDQPADARRDGREKLSADERAALDMLRDKAQGAELICIVRPLDNPDAKSEIIVLDRVSSGFLQQLAHERDPTAGRRLTSLESEPAR